jgi:hypothetical protein
MTTEEQIQIYNDEAETLVNAFRPYVDSDVAGETDFVYSRDIETKQAKSCAIIVCNNLIKYLPSFAGNSPCSPEVNKGNSEYWEQIKLILEK